MSNFKKWRQLKTRNLINTPFLKLREDQCELPDGRVMPKYFVVEFPDWVNVVPLTKDGQLIMVRQYRHAAEDAFLELPGGTMNPGSEENPAEAAARELLEETGYKAGSLISVGFHYPNPALQTNKMHSFIAVDCEKISAPTLDPYEDIEVELHPLKDLTHLMSKEIVHSLMLASLVQALPTLRSRFGLP